MVVKMGLTKALMVVTFTSIVLALGNIPTVSGQRCKETGSPRRSDFPAGFVFGTATSAYQVEGAANEAGRGSSIWDEFTHTSGKIADNSTGDVAVDQYHRYQEDVMLVKNMGLDAYRFSISWSRILPSGRGPVNEEGVAYYNRLIDYVKQQGLEPFVTIYHWDLPQALDESMSGWLNSSIVPVYAEFARTCFQLFGKKVKYWTTFNEPYHVVYEGYYNGLFAPGRCSRPKGTCSAGDSDTEPYIVAHNVLNSHAAAVQIYRKHFQAKQKGIIGLTADSPWYEPLTNSSEDVKAAERAVEFYLGWFTDPIFFGDYPASMRQYVGSRLPNFTDHQSALLKGSVDYFGLNQYLSEYANDNNTSPADSNVTITGYRDGVAIGELAPGGWIYIVPWGMSKILNWIKERYNNPIVYITENGVSQSGNSSIPIEDSLKDCQRVKYYNDYLRNVLVAIGNGSDVRGYFAWSLLDNFEWASGYTLRFGLFYVDYAQNLTRHPKESVAWFKKFLEPSIKLGDMKDTWSI